MLRTMILAGTLALVATTPVWGAPVTVNHFSDILFWTGSGTNQAAFVLEFGGANGDTDTPASIAWGYRWDGEAFVADMVFALTGSITGDDLPGVAVGADPRLGIDASNFGGGLGIGVNAFTYDQIGLPATGWTQAVREMRTAQDYSVYPALFMHAPSGPDGLAWPVTAFSASSLGISSESLVADNWYAFAGTSGDPYPPEPRSITQPVSAVPEPSAIAAGVCGLVAGVILRWRRGRTAA
jgi:hypothetical protein